MRLQRKRLASAERVKELLDSAFASRYHDVPTMLKLSSEAVVLAEEKSHELPPSLVVAAWTQYGNAHRIAGRYEEAERALDRAAALPASDTPTKAHLLEIRASLYRGTGRLEDAVQSLKAAIEEHRSIVAVDGEARALNLLGIVHLDLGDPTQALCAFQDALELLAPGVPLDVLASTGHNMVEGMIADGRLSAAASTLALLEPYHRNLTSVRLAAKAQWLRARLCRELRQLPAAQIAFERAHAILLAEPEAPEMTLLLKEMAELEVLMGRAASSDSDGNGPTGRPNQAP